jgi:subtilase family serine protease
VTGLEAGFSVECSRKVEVGAEVVPGTTLYVGLFADDTALLPESNELNNTKSAAISIIEEPQPDLVISQVSVALDGTLAVDKEGEWLSVLNQYPMGAEVKEALASAQPGEELTRLATVLNLGQEDAGPFRVGVYLSDDALISLVDDEMGSCEFTGLAAGALESEEGSVCTLTFTLPEDLTPGSSVYIGAIADDELAVKEGNEGNNTDYVEVEIEEPEGCEEVFRATLKECLRAGARSLLGCVGQALAAQRQCQRGL